MLSLQSNTSATFNYAVHYKSITFTAETGVYEELLSLRARIVLLYTT